MTWIVIMVKDAFTNSVQKVVLLMIIVIKDSNVTITHVSIHVNQTEIVQRDIIVIGKL